MFRIPKISRVAKPVKIISDPGLNRWMGNIHVKPGLLINAQTALTNLGTTIRGVFRR